MLAQALLAEFVGSFLFFSVILATGQPVAIAVALLAAIYFASHISGGHFNALVTVMMTLRGDVSASTGALYIIVQLLAAFAAFAWYKQTGKIKSA
jgi:glycerol uptake facilitator-like aquaporin